MTSTRFKVSGGVKNAVNEPQLMSWIGKMAMIESFFKVLKDANSYNKKYGMSTKVLRKCKPDTP